MSNEYDNCNETGHVFTKNVCEYCGIKLSKLLEQKNKEILKWKEKFEMQFPRRVSILEALSILDEVEARIKKEKEEIIEREEKEIEFFISEDLDDEQ